MSKSEPRLQRGQILPPGTVLPPLEGSASTPRQHDQGPSAESPRASRKTSPSLRGGGHTLAGQPAVVARRSRDDAAAKKPGRFKVLNRFTDATMRKLSDGAVRAWLILYRDTKPDGLAKTGYTDLARRMGCSVSKVKRAIRDLKQHGLLAVTRRGGPATGPNEYRVYAESPTSSSGKVGNVGIRERAAG